MKESDSEPLGLVFHRKDDGWERGGFNVDADAPDPLMGEKGFKCIQPIVDVVDEGSPAARAGLSPGDVVLGMNGEAGLTVFQVPTQSVFACTPQACACLVAHACGIGPDCFPARPRR